MKAIHFCQKLLLILTACLPLSAHSQKEQLEISGQLKWVKPGDPLVLTMLSGSQGKFEQIFFDSTQAQADGRFHLKGHVPDGPRFFFLNFKGHSDRFIHLFVDNEKVRIEEGDYTENDLPKHGAVTPFVNITGSKTTNVIKTLFPLSSLCLYSEMGMQSYIKKIEDSLGYDKSLMESVLTIRNKQIRTHLFELDQLTKQKDAALFIPQYVVTFYRLLGKDPNIIGLYNDLNEQAKNTYAGKIMKHYTTCCIGQDCKDFAMISEDHVTKRLSDIVKKGKMTLLYFWSTDQPRGDMILELSDFYRKYNSKGLNIVSVYTGTDSVSWKKTIDKDHVPWYQAADFKGMMDGISYNYGYTAEVSPFTILIDGNGKIANWMAEGAVLQYYLDKTFN